MPGNVLLITLDQWRAECLSTLGHPVLRTPHLDALAADGQLFLRHSTQTTPCGPSRASLLTGLYQHNHRSIVNGTPLDSCHSNVALEARKLGIEPVLYGYTDVSADPTSYAAGDPLLRRYEGPLPGMHPEIYLGDDQLPWRRALKAKGYDITQDRHSVFTRDPALMETKGRGPTYAPGVYKSEDSNVAFLADAVVQRLALADPSPWFIHLSILAPHPPFIVPKPYHDLYHPDDIEDPVRCETPDLEGQQHPYLAAIMKDPRGSGFDSGSKGRVFLDLDDQGIRQARATYYAMITQADEQLGRIIAQLKASGEYERTLIIVTSDHGEQLGDHWQFNKYSYHRQTTDIPLIIRDPLASQRGQAGQRIEAFSENVDIMPTILDWLGGAIPEACDGTSLLPLCRGEQPENWRTMGHFEHDFRDWRDSEGHHPLGLSPDQCAMSIIWDDQYKYVHFNALPPLFFDLSDDPGEFVNRAEDPAYRDRVLHYAQAMLSWRMDHEVRAHSHIKLTARGPERFGAVHA